MSDKDSSGQHVLQPRSGRPSSLACTQCRNKHQKCDGGVPVCARCVENNVLCSYVQSRRGGKRKAHAAAETQGPAQRPRIQSTPAAELAWEDEWQDNTVVETAPSVIPSLAQPNPALDTIQALPWVSDQAVITAPSDERLIDLYFEFFHKCHPILFPRHIFLRRPFPIYLKSVIQFIGCRYASSSPRQSFKARAKAELKLSEEKALFMVQAKLLYSIALRADGEVEESEEMLRAAMELAIALGMNKETYSCTSSQQQTIQAESCRRTWWELYINDCLARVFWRTPSPSPEAIECDVSLPCDEATYAEGSNIPTPYTVSDLETRIFAASEWAFSSFAYRIEAARLLGRVAKTCSTGRAASDKVQAADNALMSWIHHIPENKLNFVDACGRMDEMLLQAHMMVRCAEIALHFPRSNLVNSTSLPNIIAPTRLWKPALAMSTPMIHAVKTTEASKHISNLSSLCSTMRRHSPMLIPFLALCGAIQLSSYVAHSRTRDCLEQHRDRVTLILGLLRSADGMWATARTAREQLRMAAANTFCPANVPLASQTSPLDVQPGIGCGNGEEFPWLSCLNIQDLAWMPTASLQFD